MPTVKRGGSSLSPANSNVPKPIVLLSPRFHGSLKRLSDADFARVEAALQVVADCFGHPHAHSGISIRRLRNNIFECRAGLKLRLLFQHHGNTLEFFFAGNHDDVRRLIQEL
jgi:hypothetical protein